MNTSKQPPFLEHDNLATAARIFTLPGGKQPYGASLQDCTSAVAQNPAVLQGALDGPKIFAMCLLDNVTGCIESSHGGHATRLYFEQGNPVACTSPFAAKRYEDYLLTLGLLNFEDLQALHFYGFQSPRQIADHLLEKNLLQSDEMLHTLRKDFLQSLYDWIGLNSGTFRYIEERIAGNEQINISQTPTEILYEGLLRKWSSATLLHRLGSIHSILAASPKAVLECSQSHVLPLLVSEKLTIATQIWPSFNGRNRLEDIALLHHIPLEPCIASSYLLHLLGYLDIKDKAFIKHTGKQHIHPQATLVQETHKRHRLRILEKYQQVLQLSYDTILGIDKQASDYEIKKAYQDLSEAFHKKRFSPKLQEELAVELEEIAQILKDAQQTLLKADIRQGYYRCI